MARYSAVTAVDPAMQWVRAMLLPFRLGTWLKMGLIGWLAGELFGFNAGFRVPAFSGGSSRQTTPPRIPNIHWPAQDIVLLIAFVLAMAVLLGLVLTFVYSRFRFVLFDSVITKDVAIGRGWRAYRSQGVRYFGFWLLLTLFFFAGLAAIIGIPLWNAFQQGLFHGGGENLREIVFLFGSMFLGLFLFFLVTYVASTIAKDFVVPLMALDDLSIGQAISALKKMIKAEPGAFAGYLGMKLVLYIVAGMIVAIAIMIIFLILMIPTGMIALITYEVFKNTGGALGVGVIIAAVLFGALLAAVGICLGLLCAAPVTAFFASYSLFFFGGHYPKLGALLWPEQPPPLPEAQNITPVSAMQGP